jgi:ribosomal protein S18 acetylase RimI-like enzyme
MRLLPMSREEFEEFARIISVDYAESNVRAGYWRQEGALERAIAEREKLLPDGVRTKDNFLFTVKESAGDEAVGYAWLKVDVSTALPSGFIYYVYVSERFRGLGYGKKIMSAIEKKARDLGLRALYLHVFAENSAARRLYEGAGYQITSMNMMKTVEG